MSTDPGAKPAAGGKRILIVEDELMIRMLLEDMLDELGYRVAGEAAHIDEALAAAANPELDIAILDVNLHGRTIAPVAAILAERGIPFVFATGYGEQGVPDGYRDRPTLRKPFQKEALGQSLSRALAGKG
jgi:CheY-like chemotaxis protein